MKWGYTCLLNPYENWHETKLQDFFCQMIELKRRGYGHNYDFCLPVDSCDLVGDHYLVWLEVAGKKKVVSGLRSICAKRLMEYKLESPIQNLLRTIATVTDISRHHQYFSNVYNAHKDDLSQIRFYNAWTVLPEYRGRGEVSHLFKHAAIATIPLSQEEFNAPMMLGSAMPHLKTNEVLQKMGYQRWQDNEGILPGLPSPGYGMKETVFISGMGNNINYQASISDYREKWKHKEILGTHMREYQEKKSA